MESVERWIVVRPAVVAVVSTQNGGEPPVLRSHWRVHDPPGILAQRRQLARQALSDKSCAWPVAVDTRVHADAAFSRKSPRTSSRTVSV